MSEIRDKMAKGAAWMVLFKFVERGIGLLSTIVLARLLLPADFGLVAMAMSLIALLELLGAFGFDWSLIQRKDVNADHYNTVWTINFAFAASCAAVLAILAKFAADFYHEPRLQAIIYVLAFGTFLRGFENVGTVNFRRDLQFNREFKFLLIKKLASVGVTIPLAIATRSYWALVIGMVTGKAVGAISSYIVEPFRPRFSLKAFGELFNFSKWIFINNLVSFLNTRASDLIIGKLAGAPALGLYNVANEISNLPTTELIAPINRAAFPGYSRLAHDLAKLRESFMSVISMIAMFALPAGTGIALVADLLVPVVLGDKWSDAIPLIQIIAFYGVITALQTNIVYVYVAVGKPRLVTMVGIAQFAVLLISLFTLIPMHGVLGAAWGFLITAIILIPVNQWLVSVQLKLSTRKYIQGFWRSIVATLVMIGVVLLCKQIIVTHLHQFFALMILSLIGALTYMTMILTLWRLSACPEGPERFCMNRIKNVWDNRFKMRSAS